MSIGRIENVENKKEYVRYATLGGSGGESGIQVGNVRDLILEEGSGNLTLRWKDPEDVVFNGETIGEWAGTKVVRKEGSSPGSIEDGTLVVDNTVRDQYAVNGLRDSDVAADTQYNYALFPYTSKNVYTMSDKNKVNGKLLDYKYGLNNNTWEDIIEICRSGLATRYFKFGEKKDGFTIVGINHDYYADGSGKAPVTFSCAGFVAGGEVGTVNHGQVKRWHSDKYDIVDAQPKLYKDSDIFKYLKELYEGSQTDDSIPSVLKSNIRPVIKKCIKNVNTGETEDVVCNLFLMSAAEIGKNSNGKETITDNYMTEGEKYEWNSNYGVYHWTRTPYMQGSSVLYAWFKQQSGDYLLEKTSTDQSRRARFCFCV